jgi:hypothetical protein
MIMNAVNIAETCTPKQRAACFITLEHWQPTSKRKYPSQRIEPTQFYSPLKHYYIVRQCIWELMRAASALWQGMRNLNVLMKRRCCTKKQYIEQIYKTLGESPHSSLQAHDRGER